MPRSKSKTPQRRPLELKDVEQVTAIYAYYVASGVATFDEIAPDAGTWSAKAGNIVARGFPFLVAEVGGEVAGQDRTHLRHSSALWPAVQDHDHVRSIRKSAARLWMRPSSRFTAG